MTAAMVGLACVAAWPPVMAWRQVRRERRARARDALIEWGEELFG